MNQHNHHRRAWVVSVDMGYGHQRAAYPFRGIAHERIITANNDQIISPRERRYWESARSFYEMISRLKNTPGIGNFLFRCYDRLQAISPFYPFRDLSKSTFATLYLRRRIRQGLCRSLVDYLCREPLPILATHFIPALAADYHGLERVFCVITDTDINRVWVAADPRVSRITYLAPSRHAMTRLKQYGVPEERIILTGFPLPKEILGGPDRSKVRRDLAERLPNLDPKGKFTANYRSLLTEKLGTENLRESSAHPLTISYLVGGAGAQREIGTQIVRALKERLNGGVIRINLVAGTRFDVHQYFHDQLRDLDVKRGVEVIFAHDKFRYFKKINNALRTTDILWTKPSELTFYTALGLPVIMSPPVGAHEVQNKEWLTHIGSGIAQEDLACLNDWLFYILESGKFAEAAWDGFMNAPATGVYKIEEALFG